MAGFAALFFMPTEKRLLMLARFDFLLLLAFLWVLSAVIVTVKLRSSAPRYLFVLLALSVSLPVILWFVGLKWDLLVRVPGHIAIDGRAISSGRVYRGWNGETAVFLDNLDSLDIYVPALGDVLSCDRTLFHDYRLFGRLEKGANEYFCMSSAKEEINRNLKVARDEISFNRPQGRVIERVTVRR